MALEAPVLVRFDLTSVARHFSSLSGRAKELDENRRRSLQLVDMFSILQQQHTSFDRACATDILAPFGIRGVILVDFRRWRKLVSGSVLL